MIWLLVVIVVVLAAGAYAVSIWLHPWAPCRACGGSGKSRDVLWRSAYGTCKRCGGRGRHPRAGIRVLTPGRHKRLARAGHADHKSIDKRKD